MSRALSAAHFFPQFLCGAGTRVLHLVLFFEARSASGGWYL